MRYSPHLRRLAQAAYDRLTEESRASARLRSHTNKPRRWAAEEWLDLVETPLSRWHTVDRHIQAARAIVRIDALSRHTHHFVTSLAVQWAFGSVPAYLLHTRTFRGWIDGEKARTSTPTLRRRSIYRKLGELIRLYYRDFLIAARPVFDQRRLAFIHSTRKPLYG